MEKKLMLLKSKENTFGVAHYYIGELEEVSQDFEFKLSSACQIREMVMTTVKPDKSQQQSIDYVVMPDDLTTEGILTVSESEVLMSREVLPSHRLYHLWKQAVSQYNAARAGIVLPHQTSDLNIVQN